MNTIDSLPLPTLVLTPLRQAVPASGGALEVLVRVQAPAQPAGAASAAARSQLRLALVVDRSGSMSGEPLHQALRCVRHIVERLQPQDEVAVVLYDNRVDVAVPLQPAAQKDAILAALAGVESGGNTALFQGWLAGAQQLGVGRAGAISRVLLLSDGQANMGLTELAEVSPHCAQWHEQGVSTTTVGLGAGFNEDLMVGMARTGGGQAYYGQTAEDLHDSFDEELALLEALFLRHLRVKPVAAEGVIAEALSALDLPAQDGWRTLSDLPWRAESWLLLRLHVAAQAPSGGAARPLLALNFEAVRKDGSAVQLTAPVLALPVVSDEAFAALAQDETVARRAQEIDFARASAEARELLMRGDSAAARERLRRLESQVQAHPWLAEKVVRLRALLELDAAMAAKEMRFKSSRLGTRVTQVNEVLYSADETNSDAIPAYLRRKAEEGRGRKS
jgi:Ca-activated chloride channel family protein